MNPGETIDDIPEAVLEECCQIVKANSIEGSKKKTVTVVYTPASNLRKDGSMDVGQVSFHRDSLCKFRRVTKDKELLRPLIKSKTESDDVDYAREKAMYDAEQRRKGQAAARTARQAEAALIAQRKAEKEARSYDRMFDGAEMTSNADMRGMTADEYIDNFM
jgi:hypothetical protein